MTPIQQMYLGVGASKKTYMEDVFHTHLYTGTGSSRSITTGIDMTKGGLVWHKPRVSDPHWLFDTVRGTTKVISSNSGDAESTEVDTITAFNDNGYTLGASAELNSSGATKQASWTFRKAPGFFDIVTWTGNGSNRTIAHSLESIPGMILIKNLTDSGENWVVYHRGTNGGVDPEDYFLSLNAATAQINNDVFNDTAPTASVFSLGTNVKINGSSKSYVAYVFAGGESEAATARSVDFDGTGDYLTTSTSSDYDLGTGDFTLECWIKWDATASNLIFLEHRTSSDQNDLVLYVDNDAIIFNSWSADRITTGAISNNQWYHVALVRNSATTTMYVNGISQGTYADTRDYDNEQMRIGIDNTGNYDFDGKISNVRLVKGTAVYTSSFKPPTEPLTNITNTKLLCCNNSSVTGTTTGTVSSSGNPTASTDSPFDDPAGFAFGDSGKENVIKCGSYVGNNNADGPEVNLGWELQYIMIKRSSASEGWVIWDSMRGISTGGADIRLEADTSGGDTTGSDFLDLTPTGFKITTTNSTLNAASDYIYIAIRRPDPLVQKPAELGTDVFAMAYGNSGGTNPSYVSNFPVDFAFNRQPSTSENWYTAARLIQGKYLHLNNTDAEASASSNYLFDHNNGWRDGSAITSYLSWNFKRHAGFDVVTYKGDGVAGRQIPHSLSKTPEMMWFKNRDHNNTVWGVYHKGLNGGSNPQEKYIALNSSNAEATSSIFWNNTAPTATSFTVGTIGEVNNNNDDIIALLFASVDGISKVGSFVGSDSDQTITTGFQPRFLIVKQTSGSSASWYVMDTTRGWGSGNDNWLILDGSQAQSSNDVGAPTSTGFTVKGNFGGINDAGFSCIYYAHA